MNDVISDLKFLASNFDLLTTNEMSLFTLSILVMIGMVGTLLLHYSLAARVKKQSKDTQKLVGGIRGKLEKIEAELNSVNTALARSKELDAGKLDEIKSIVEQLKKKD